MIGRLTSVFAHSRILEVAFSRSTAAALLLLAGSSLGVAQQCTISTFAGGALPVNIPGPSASLGGVPNFLFFTLGPRDLGIATDAAGNSFIASSTYNVVLRLDATAGILTLAAGNGTAGLSGENGPATSAQLGSPNGVAVDSAGNLFIADSANLHIRKVSNGIITTVAGNGTAGFSGDNGPATSSILSFLQSVAVDAAGNLYIADGGNTPDLKARVRKISNGIITTIAGGGSSLGDNGLTTSAQCSA